jgi:hypothetical protein
MDKGKDNGLTVGQNRKNKEGILRGIIRGNLDEECKIKIIDNGSRIIYYIDIAEGCGYRKDRRILSKLLMILPGVVHSDLSYIYYYEHSRRLRQSLRYELHFKY